MKNSAGEELFKTAYTYDYDSETGFYYLQSRYYDPKNCRFINADSYASAGTGFLGYNMFAYCSNQPICRSDPSGKSWWKDFLTSLKGYLEEEKEDAQDNENKTETIGVTGSTAFGLAVSGSTGITWDRKGNIGWSRTINGGGGFPSAGVGVFDSVTNAPTIYAQEGMGFTIGGSAGPEVVAVGAEYNMLVDKKNDKVYHGYTVSATYGLYPTIVEAHGEVGYTWVSGFNVYDAAISIIELFLGD